MRFTATRRLINNRERFDEQEIEHLKEHVEIVYQHVKDYLNDSDEDFTIPDGNSEDVYGLLREDSEQPLIHSVVYTDPISKYDQAFFSNEETLQDIYGELDALFSQYSIEVRYCHRIDFELFKQMIGGEEI